MAGEDVKLSLLPVAGSLGGTEIVAIVQGGVTKRTTLNAIRTIDHTKVTDWDAAVTAVVEPLIEDLVTDTALATAIAPLDTRLDAIEASYVTEASLAEEIADLNLAQYATTSALATAVTNLNIAVSARLQLAGGTMTGPLTLAGNPGAALHAAPRQYVDAGDAALDARLDTVESDYVTAVILGNAIEALDLDQYALAADVSTLTTAVGARVPLAGGTMTGFLVANANPTAPLHYATKQYVDSADAALDGRLDAIEADFMTSLEVAAAISALSLGTAATRNTGTSSGQVPVLGAGGLLPTSVLPPVAITQPFVVASQAAMLALTAERGDVAIRTDNGLSYILSTDSPTTLADWLQLTSAAGGVATFNARTGTVVLEADDVSDALGFTPQAADATLTALAALDGTAGLLEQTGADVFVRRAIGVGASSSIPTRGDADSRYAPASNIAFSALANLTTGRALVSDGSGDVSVSAVTATELGHLSGVTSAIQTQLGARQPLDATLTALAGLDSTAGLLEQTGADTFARRALGVGASTSVPTRADADTRYSALSHSHTTSEISDFLESLQDAVAAMIQNGTGITWSYNDAAGTLTPTVTGGGGGGVDPGVENDWPAAQHFADVAGIDATGTNAEADPFRLSLPLSTGDVVPEVILEIRGPEIVPGTPYDSGSDPQTLVTLVEMVPDTAFGTPNMVWSLVPGWNGDHTSGRLVGLGNTERPFIRGAFYELLVQGVLRDTTYDRMYFGAFNDGGTFTLASSAVLGFSAAGASAGPDIALVRDGDGRLSIVTSRYDATPKDLVLGSLVVSGATSGAVTVAAPDEVTDYTLVLPAEDGSPGDVLTLAGDGTTVWQAPSGGGGLTLVTEATGPNRVTIDGRVRAGNDQATVSAYETAGGVVGFVNYNVPTSPSVAFLGRYDLVRIDTDDGDRTATTEALRARIETSGSNDVAGTLKGFEFEVELGHAGDTGDAFGAYLSILNSASPNTGVLTGVVFELSNEGTGDIEAMVASESRLSSSAGTVGEGIGHRILAPTGVGDFDVFHALVLGAPDASGSPNSFFTTITPGDQPATYHYVTPIDTPSANDVLRAASVTGSGPYTVVLEWAAAGSGAPVDATYIVATSNGSLSAERVLTDTATIVWDPATGGQMKANVPDGAITLAKMASMATASFLGRNTAGTGAPEVLSVATAKTLLNLSGTNNGDQTITLTGDVTGSGTGSFAATIANNAVSLTKLADIATARILGRVTASSGDPEALTGTQATTLLDVFTTSLKGLVPSGGSASTILRGNASWGDASTLPVTVTSYTSGPQTLTLSQYLILCNASGGAFTLNLPAASGAGGHVYAVMKTDSSGNDVTVDGNSSETINGATTSALSAQYQTLVIACDGTAWFAF